MLPTHFPPPSCTHAQSCNPMDCSPPGSFVHGLFQARILEWVAISFFINCGKFLKRWEYQTTLPASWETCMQVKKQVRTRHGTTDWFKIGKGVYQGYVLSPCLFNLYAEYIMRNAGLGEAQARIKTAGRNISNLRYSDDTTLMAESKRELKNLLMKVKAETEIMA